MDRDGFEESGPQLKNDSPYMCSNLIMLLGKNHLKTNDDSP